MVTDPHLAPGSDGPYYVIVDVDIRDVPRYLTYMEKVRPALEAAGGRYLARGGAFTTYEGSRRRARDSRTNGHMNGGPYNPSPAHSTRAACRLHRWPQPPGAIVPPASRAASSSASRPVR
jgi:hypothetical protein